MEFIQEITLDLNANTTYTTIAAKQGDSARWLKIHLTKNNISYGLDPSHNFMFRMRKPDGHGVINPAVVELASSDTYVFVIITEDNFNNYTKYFKKIDDSNYEEVPISNFFEEVSEPDPSQITSYYVYEASSNTYRKATPEDSGPFYRFIGSTEDIYYLQDNINLEESTVNVQLTEQVLKVAGRGYADIIEYDGEGGALSSVSFIINVMARPDVAGNATSTDEFQKLVEVVAEADDIIGEAETWTRGTNHDIVVAGPSYVMDKNIDASNFGQKNKSYLYTKANNSYIQVPSDASYNDTVTYYYLDASASNNAKYYADQAAIQWDYYNNLTVKTIENYTGTDAIVSISRDAAGMATQYVFGLPAGQTGDTGATGPTGPATCVASNTEPTEDHVIVWIDTNGEMQPFIGTANQIIYDSEASYDSHTVGQFLQGIGDIQEAAVVAATSASMAAEAAEAAKTSAEKAYTSAQSALISAYNLNVRLSTEITDRENADTGLQNLINTKITNPDTNIEVDLTNGIQSLIIDRADGNISWGHDLYNNLTERPLINGATLTGGANLNLLANAPKTVDRNNLADNVTISLNNADTAIQLIELNNNLMIPADYKAPFDLYTNATASNWDDVKGSLYYYDSTTSDYVPITDQAYSSNTFYYTHDSSHDNQKFVNLGTILNENNIINENLIDNSWFQVNQNNFTSAAISSSGEYLCDRWKVMVCQEQTRTITLTDSGLTIGTASNNDALNDFAIGQIIEENLSKNLVGKTVCLSVNYIIDNTSHIGSGYFTCTQQGTPFIQLNNDIGWFVRLVKVNDSNRFAFQIAAGQNITGASLQDTALTIRSVKLEMGKFSTLSQDIAPTYVEELAKCQKYFYKCENSTDKPIVVGQGTAQQANKMAWTFKLPYVMTSDSAIIALSTDLIVRKGFTYAHQAGTLTSAAIGTSLRYQGTDGIYFETDTASLASGVPYFVLLPPASDDIHPYVTISVDI